MLVVLIILFVVLSFRVDNFLSVQNMISLALAVSMVGMVACTMLFCMASGDFDLSVESVVAFAGVLTAVVIDKTGNPWIGGLCGVLAGLLVGIVNGYVIAYVGINAFITTLATMQISRGLGLIASGGSAVGISNLAFFDLGSGMLFGIPTPVWITVACFVVFGIILHRTEFGRNTLAVGGNREAARLSGIAVRRVRAVIFAVQGAMAGLAGVVLASRVTSGQPNTSVGFSMDVISACVLGGVSLSGGVGSMMGVIVGVLIMGTVQNAMNLCNVPAFYQYVVRGAILLLAVMFDLVRRRRVRA